MSLAWGQADPQGWERPWISAKKQIPTRGAARGESRQLLAPQGEGIPLLSPWTPGAAAGGLWGSWLQFPEFPGFERAAVQPGVVCPPHVLSLSGFTGPALAPLPSLPDESPLRGEFYRSLFIAAGWGSVS